MIDPVCVTFLWGGLSTAGVAAAVVILLLG